MSYLDVYLNGEKLIKTAQKCLDIVSKVDFNTIAVRGNSGLLVGSVMAALSGKDLLIVRKDTDKSHSNQKIEGWGYKQKILMVDDFIASGETIDQIYETCTEHCDSPRFKGILLYASLRKTKYAHPDGTVFPVYSLERTKHAGE